MMSSAMTSSQPLYYQVAFELRSQIEQGRYRPGNRIASELELADSFGVSRVTVRKALRELCEMEILEHRGKRGHFVSKMRDSGQEGRRSLYQATLNAGHKPASKIVSMQTVEATGREAALFGMPLRSDLIEIQRLRYADGVVFALERILLPPDLFAGINPWEMEHKSLIALMRERFGIAIKSSTQLLSACLPTCGQAKLLELDGKAPILKVRANSYGETGRLVKRSEIFYNTEVMSYTFRWDT